MNSSLAELYKQKREIEARIKEIRDFSLQVGYVKYEKRTYSGRMPADYVVSISCPTNSDAYYARNGMTRKYAMAVKAKSKEELLSELKKVIEDLQCCYSKLEQKFRDE